MQYMELRSLLHFTLWSFFKRVQPVNWKILDMVQKAMMSILFVQYSFTSHIDMQDIQWRTDVTLPNTTFKIVFCESKVEYYITWNK